MGHAIAEHDEHVPQFHLHVTFVDGLPVNDVDLHGIFDVLPVPKKDA